MKKIDNSHGGRETMLLDAMQIFATSMLLPQNPQNASCHPPQGWMRDGGSQGGI